MFDKVRLSLITILGVVLCLFTLVEVNFPIMQQEISRLAVFVMLGLVLCFLFFPLGKRFAEVRWLRYVDIVLAILSVVCCGYVILQNESLFSALWIDGQSLGDRAGKETNFDMMFGLVGLFLVLEATRRAIGWIVPVLAILIVFHSFYGYMSDGKNTRFEANILGVVKNDDGEPVFRKNRKDIPATAVGNWPAAPKWLMIRSGEGLRSLSSTTFLKGVFGIPASVMFKYVFLFVIFGAFLEISGATRFIIDFARKVFSRFTGGPALVSVVGSGMMGSLSGSAVANAMMTGSFAIPMMRSDGFEKHTAGGITAAAATGGALVPPVMGAGAYMMLELVEPTVSFLQVAQAAVIPAFLYYFSLVLIVYFYSKRQKHLGINVGGGISDKPISIRLFDGIVFVSALATLVGLLLLRFTPFKAVTGSLVVILVLTCFRKTLGDERKGLIELTHAARLPMLMAFAAGTIAWAIYQVVGTDKLATEISTRKIFEVGLDSTFVGMFLMLVVGLMLKSWRPTLTVALSKSAKNGIALVAASACVGIIIGVVTQTGVASVFSSNIKAVVESNLLLALVGIMFCSIILGMGVPSVVCYLLVATLMATLLGDMGVIPLGAHLFIFYFGMMSMVTPPVALAAYASASIAEAKIMQTAWAAFRFALVGFTLPFMFIYRPALLLMNGDAWQAWMDAEKNTAEKEELLTVANSALPGALELIIAFTAAVLGIVALAGAIAGYLRGPVNMIGRAALVVSAVLLLLPVIKIGGNDVGIWVNLVGAILLFGVIGASFFRRGDDGDQFDLKEPAVE